MRLCSYTLKRKAFFRNLGTILLLAVVGTVLNNLVFGYLLFGFAKAGWIPLDANNPLECLLFGAVVSATDPVATLVSATRPCLRLAGWMCACVSGAARELNFLLPVLCSILSVSRCHRPSWATKKSVPTRCSTLWSSANRCSTTPSVRLAHCDIRCRCMAVSEEGALTLALFHGLLRCSPLSAIVLYKTFEAALPSAGDTDGGFGSADLLRALGTFIGVSVGSILVGVSVALLCCFIFKQVNMSRFPVYEFTLVTLFAYLSYFLAEMAYLSGILSIFICAVCLAHYK